MVDSKFAERGGLVLLVNFPQYEGEVFGCWFLKKFNLLDFAQNLLSGCGCNKLREPGYQKHFLVPSSSRN
jgi:hypothetical protein